MTYARDPAPRRPTRYESHGLAHIPNLPSRASPVAHLVPVRLGRRIPIWHSVLGAGRPWPQALSKHNITRPLTTNDLGP